VYQELNVVTNIDEVVYTAKQRWPQYKRHCRKSSLRK